jgi:hypothetical protein
LFGSSQLYPAKASLPVLATYYHCPGSGLARIRNFSQIPYY